MRVKGGTVRHDNRKRILKRAEGYFGSRHRLYKTAKEAVLRSEANAFIGRKQRKRNYRKLWVSRISAACKANDTSYSQFMYGLKLSGIALNRKMLSEIAANQPDEFKKLVDTSSAAIKNSAAK